MRLRVPVSHRCPEEPMREAILNSLNRRPNTTEGLMYQLKATRLKKRQLLNDTLVALMEDKLIFYVRVANKSVFMTYEWCKAKHGEVA